MNNPHRVAELLGPGPYPAPLDSAEFSAAVAVSVAENVAIIQPGLKGIGADSSHTHSHNSYEFTIPRDHSPLLRQGGRTLRLPAGMLLPCNPGVVHGPAEPLTAARFTAVLVRSDYLQGLARSPYRCRDVRFVETPNHPSTELRALIERFVVESEGTHPGRALYLDTLEVQITLTLLRQVAHDASRSRDHSADCVGIHRAVEMLRAHLEEEFSSQQLSEACGMSRYHFFRAFKAHTGATPYEYLTRIRVERAAELLAEDSASITDICFQCGFVNHSHFTSTFRRCTGLTPTEYRRHVAVRR